MSERAEELYKEMLEDPDFACYLYNIVVKYEQKFDESEWNAAS